jgi:hypothetical protein
MAGFGKNATSGRKLADRGKNPVKADISADIVTCAPNLAKNAILLYS